MTLVLGSLAEKFRRLWTIEFCQMFLLLLTVLLGANATYVTGAHAFKVGFTAGRGHHDAWTTNQVVGLWPNDVRLTDRWQKVELFFSALPRLPLGAVDLLAIEFIADGPRDFLVDDLQLLGPWKLEPE